MVMNITRGVRPPAINQTPVVVQPARASLPGVTRDIRPSEIIKDVRGQVISDSSKFVRLGDGALVDRQTFDSLPVDAQTAGKTVGLKALQMAVEIRNQAVDNILNKLKPYTDDSGSIRLAEALKAGAVTEKELLDYDVFDPQAVTNTMRYNEVLHKLEPYKVETQAEGEQKSVSYDIAKYLRDESQGDLEAKKSDLRAVGYDDETIQKVEDYNVALNKLEPYKTADGNYNILGYLSKTGDTAALKTLGFKDEDVQNVQRYLEAEKNRQAWEPYSGGSAPQPYYDESGSLIVPYGADVPGATLKFGEVEPPRQPSNVPPPFGTPQYTEWYYGSPAGPGYNPNDNVVSVDRDTGSVTIINRDTGESKVVGMVTPMEPSKDIPAGKILGVHGGNVILNDYEGNSKTVPVDDYNRLVQQDEGTLFNKFKDLGIYDPDSYYYQAKGEYYNPQTIEGKRYTGEDVYKLSLQYEQQASKEAKLLEKFSQYINKSPETEPEFGTTEYTDWYYGNKEAPGYIDGRPITFNILKIAEDIETGKIDRQSVEEFFDGEQINDAVAVYRESKAKIDALNRLVAEGKIEKITAPDNSEQYKILKFLKNNPDNGAEILKSAGFNSGIIGDMAVLAPYADTDSLGDAVLTENGMYKYLLDNGNSDEAKQKLRNIGVGDESQKTDDGELKSIGINDISQKVQITIEATDFLNNTVDGILDVSLANQAGIHWGADPNQKGMKSVDFDYAEAYALRNAFGQLNKPLATKAEVEAAGLDYDDAFSNVFVAWNNADKETRQEIASVFALDAYKDSKWFGTLGGSVTELGLQGKKSLEGLQEAKGLKKVPDYIKSVMVLGSTIPATAIGTPIAKSGVGLPVSWQEWVFGGAIAASYMTPLAPARVAALASVPIVIGLTGVGSVEYVKNWNKMTDAEKAVYGTFLALPVALGAKGIAKNAKNVVIYAGRKPISVATKTFDMSSIAMEKSMPSAILRPGVPKDVGIDIVQTGQSALRMPRGVAEGKKTISIVDNNGVIREIELDLARPIGIEEANIQALKEVSSVRQEVHGILNRVANTKFEGIPENRIGALKNEIEKLHNNLVESEYRLNNYRDYKELNSDMIRQELDRPLINFEKTFKLFDNLNANELKYPKDIADALGESFSNYHEIYNKLPIDAGKTWSYSTKVDILWKDAQGNYVIRPTPLERASNILESMSPTGQDKMYTFSAVGDTAWLYDKVRGGIPKKISNLNPIEHEVMVPRTGNNLDFMSTFEYASGNAWPARFRDITPKLKAEYIESDGRFYKLKEGYVKGNDGKVRKNDVVVSGNEKEYLEKEVPLAEAVINNPVKVEFIGYISDLKELPPEIKNLYKAGKYKEAGELFFEMNEAGKLKGQYPAFRTVNDNMVEPEYPIAQGTKEYIVDRGGVWADKNYYKIDNFMADKLRDKLPKNWESMNQDAKDQWYYDHGAAIKLAGSGDRIPITWVSVENPYGKPPDFLTRVTTEFGTEPYTRMKRALKLLTDKDVVVTSEHGGVTQLPSLRRAELEAKTYGHVHVQSPNEYFAVKQFGTKNDGTGLVVLGDRHGVYDGMIKDINYGFDKPIVSGREHPNTWKWVGDKQTIVQVGDIVDRGAYYQEIRNAMNRLHEQSKKTGGRVERLLGNHELAYINGDKIKGVEYPEKYANEVKRTILEDILSGRVKAAVEVDGQLFTHAGLSVDKFPEYRGKSAAYIANDLNNKLLEAVKSGNYSNKMFDKQYGEYTGADKVGISDDGGIFWHRPMDGIWEFKNGKWNYVRPFDMDLGYKQFYGHTPNIVRGGNSWAITEKSPNSIDVETAVWWNAPVRLKDQAMRAYYDTPSVKSLPTGRILASPGEGNTIVYKFSDAPTKAKLKEFLENRLGEGISDDIGMEFTDLGVSIKVPDRVNPLDIAKFNDEFSQHLKNSNFKLEFDNISAYPRNYSPSYIVLGTKNDVSLARLLDLQSKIDQIAKNMGYEKGDFKIQSSITMAKITPEKGKIYQKYGESYVGDRISRELSKYYLRKQRESFSFNASDLKLKDHTVKVMTDAEKKWLQNNKDVVEKAHESERLVEDYPPSVPDDIMVTDRLSEKEFIRLGKVEKEKAIQEAGQLVYRPEIIGSYRPYAFSEDDYFHSKGAWSIFDEYEKGLFEDYGFDKKSGVGIPGKISTEKYGLDIYELTEGKQVEGEVPEKTYTGLEKLTGEGIEVEPPEITTYISPDIPYYGYIGNEFFGNEFYGVEYPVVEPHFPVDSYKKPPVVMPKESKEDQYKRLSETPAVIEWRHGRYWVALPPRADGSYHDEDMEFIDKPLPGTYKFATGPGSAAKTIQVLNGVPVQPADVDIGWAKIRIEPRGKDVAIRFSGGDEAIATRWEQEKQEKIMDDLARESYKDIPRDEIVQRIKIPRAPSQPRQKLADRYGGVLLEETDVKNQPLKTEDKPLRTSKRTARSRKNRNFSERYYLGRQLREPSLGTI